MMTEVKFCASCSTTKPLGQFAKAGRYLTTQLYRPICKPCYNVKLRTSYEGRRMRFENAERVEESPHPKGLLPFRWVGARA